MTRPSSGAQASRPAAIRPRRRQNQGVVLGLTDIEEIFRIYEHAESAESPFGESANQHMRPARAGDRGSRRAPACR